MQVSKIVANHGFAPNVTRWFGAAGAVMLLIGSMPSAAASFGADVRAFQRFQSDFINHGGYLTSSAEFDQTNGKTNWEISGTDTAVFNSGGAQPFSTPVSADYYASADLSTGKLKILAENPVIIHEGITYGFTGHARSNASIFDTLTFDWTSEQLGTYQQISIRTKLEGTISLGPIPQSSASVDLTLQAYHRLDGGFYFSGGNLGQLTNYGDNIYGVDFFVTASNDPITIFALLSADAHAATVDYSHTATLDLIAPAGVSYTSASGTFLQGAVVPEPATWTMMISGFGLVGGAMRGRMRVARPT